MDFADEKGNTASPCSDHKLPDKNSSSSYKKTKKGRGRNGARKRHASSISSDNGIRMHGRDVSENPCHVTHSSELNADPLSNNGEIKKRNTKALIPRPRGTDGSARVTSSRADTRRGKVKEEKITRHLPTDFLAHGVVSSVVSSVV